MTICRIKLQETHVVHQNLPRSVEATNVEISSLDPEGPGTTPTAAEASDFGLLSSMAEDLIKICHK